MVAYLLDTNICIYFIKKEPISVLRKLQSKKSGEVAISLVTLAELEFGASKSKEPSRARAVLEEFVLSIPALPLALNVGRTYGNIRADLERKGQPIGGNDLWIAAHALSLDVTLVTNNEREFRRVKGLTVENWVSKAAT
jgi:tRNA(fMet)-specific endonuclease VapC